MRFLLPLLSLALARIVSSESLSFGGANVDKQATLITEEDSTSVPGDSPLEYCTSETSQDLLEIEHVNLAPNPPKAGTTLTVEAVGNFKEEIQQGAKVHLQVKYRKYIKLIDNEADLCETMENVDLECPLEKGRTVITKNIDLPEQIPPGDYEVRADVYTEDGRKITCLTANVKFGGDGKGLFS